MGNAGGNGGEFSSPERFDFVAGQAGRPPDDWKPAHTFNLLSDPSIPPSTYAKFVVDTVTSLGQRAEQSFFKSQAQTHIGLALEVLSRMDMEVTLENVRDFLLDDNTMNDGFEGTSRRIIPRTATKFHGAFSKPISRSNHAEQMGGVKETIANYLQFFLTPDIAQVFCASEEQFRFQRN